MTYTLILLFICFWHTHYYCPSHRFVTYSNSFFPSGSDVNKIILPIGSWRKQDHYFDCFMTYTLSFFFWSVRDVPTTILRSISSWRTHYHSSFSQFAACTLSFFFPSVRDVHIIILRPISSWRTHYHSSSHRFLTYTLLFFFPSVRDVHTMILLPSVRDVHIIILLLIGSWRTHYHSSHRFLTYTLSFFPNSSWRTHYHSSSLCWTLEIQQDWLAVLPHTT